MPACPSCGHTFESLSKFCPECGTRLSPADSQGPALQPAGEPVIGVIGGLDLKRSFFKSEPVNLVITPDRTLCVPVATLLEAALLRAQNDAKTEGKGLIGQFKAKAEVAKASNFSAEFRNIPPEEILKKFSSSIVIPHKDLLSITIRHRNLDFEGEDISSSAEDWPVSIKVGKTEYSLVAKVDPVQQFRLNANVDKLIGDRLKVLF